MISRKTLQSFLSIMLVVFLTAGCGGANGTADNSSSTSTNSPSADSMTVKEESNLDCIISYKCRQILQGLCQ